MYPMHRNKHIYIYIYIHNSNVHIYVCINDDNMHTSCIYPHLVSPSHYLIRSVHPFISRAINLIETDTLLNTQYINIYILLNTLYTHIYIVYCLLYGLDTVIEEIEEDWVI